jgi:hypothetical protein
MNYTRPHCVNQMGKTHSKPLAARHGRGTAWARHATCESAFKYPSSRVQTRPELPGIFQGGKILSTPSFGGEVKPSAPCRRFAACERSLNVPWKSAFRQNYRPTFSPTVPPFAARISRVVLTWRRLVAKVGTSKSWGGGIRVAQ